MAASVFSVRLLLLMLPLSNALPTPSKSLRAQIRNAYYNTNNTGVVNATEAGFCSDSDTVKEQFCRTQALEEATDTIRRLSSQATPLVYSDCCQPRLMRNMSRSGIYSLSAPLNQMAYCDMDDDGGGWIVILRRTVSSKVRSSFDRNWNRYKNGFGKLDKTFWLGLDAIHRLSILPGGLELKVELIRSGNVDYLIKYSHFGVNDEKSNYSLSVRGYDESSTLFDFLAYANGFPFITRDHYHKYHDYLCATFYEGGWWYDSSFNFKFDCAMGAALTSGYRRRSVGRGVSWSWGFGKPSTVMTRMVMKVRRKSWHCGNVELPSSGKIEVAAIRTNYPQLFGITTEDDGEGEGSGSGDAGSGSSGSGESNVNNGDMLTPMYDA